MNIMNHKSALRNLTMAMMIIPISFIANIVRVCILVLVVAGPGLQWAHFNG